MKKAFKFLSVLFAIMFLLPGFSAPRKNVISNGTKVATATATKSNPCQEKYNACMDTGCILDNDAGGRCQCSNQIKELNKQLKQIEKDFKSSVDLANNAVEKIKSGDAVNEMFSAAGFDDDDESDDSDLDVTVDSIGDKLRADMHKICAEKIPECASQLTLIKNMYSQMIKSDCAGYENALKQRGRDGRATLAAAEKSVRDAALEKYETTNKYDLGQCTLEFTKCMQTTAGCGNDFTGCVDTVGRDNIYGGADTVAIAGENTSVVIAKSTKSMLESKRIICESVLNNCVNVKDNVWDAFLKSVASDIKLAETKSESKIRTSCLNNISNCFVNACKDTIDGTASYDSCLTRPEMVKSFCRVELEPCLAATGGTYDNPEISTLWPGILAKLSAMRVDSCTKEIKECMQSSDRCGSDYSQCIGLDTNIIMRMCPYDKLPGCQKVYGKEKVQGDMVYDEVAQIVEGVILNIDNEMLKTCEAAVDNAMTKVCGDSESCSQYALGTQIGAQSLDYKVCQYTTKSPDSTEGFEPFDCRASIDNISDYELGRNKNAKTEELGVVLPFAGVISGIIKWESIEITDKGTIDIDGYISALQKEQITDVERERIISELNQLQNNINSVIKTVETDNFVQYCITGRTVPGVTDMFKNNKVRFPQLSNTVRKNIANAALAQAKENYYKKYDELSERMQSDLTKIQERMANNLKQNGEDAKKAAAREACVGMAAISAFAKAPVGQAIWAKIMVGIIVVVAIIVATIFTCGAAGVASAALMVSVIHTGVMIGEVAFAVTGAIISAGVAAAGIANAAQGKKYEAQNRAIIEAQTEQQTETHGEFYSNSWNYMEKITTDFDNKTGVCKKCVSKRYCKRTKWSLFTDRTCKEWASDTFENERCTEIQF